ncbi:MAG: PASTA domain-containing protein [Nakamurella sp.]
MSDHTSGPDGQLDELDRRLCERGARWRLEEPTDRRLEDFLPADVGARPPVKKRSVPWLLVAAAVVLIVAAAVAITLVVHRGDGQNTATAPSVSPATTVPVTSSQQTVVTRSQGLLGSTSTATMTALPNLVGLNQAAAKHRLASLGLLARFVPVASGPGQQDLVLSQSPAAGASVKANTVVTVSVGNVPSLVTVPNKVTVPNLVGMSLTDATATLKAAKLTIVTSYRASTLPKDQVMAMSGTHAGDKVVQGSQVTVVLSDQSQFVTPDITLLTPADAVAQLNRAGWTGDLSTLTQTSKEVPDQASWGTIISQTPTVGTHFSVTAPPRVTVGAEPTFTMPNLQGLTVPAAENQLRGLGWQGIENATKLPNTAKDVTLDGIVTGFNPPVGARVKITDSIDLSYYDTFALPPPTR